MANSDTPQPWTGVTEGRIVHVGHRAGDTTDVGHCQPAMVVRRFGDTGTVNLLVFRDGSNDAADGQGSAPTHWLTSIQHESSGVGSPNWHWPERA